jgi:hypothetical protein
MPRGETHTRRDGEVGITGRTDHIEIDWPRSLGFFGGLGVATALELVPLPIALFVASVPFLKLMNRPGSGKPPTFFSHLVDGAAKPVGGDTEGTVRWASRRQRRTVSRSQGGRRRAR